MLSELTDERLRDLVAQPESEHLEFKNQLRDPGIAAHEIASLANSGGGLLVVGVEEREGPIGVGDVEKQKELLDRAVALVSPSVDVETGTAELDGNWLVLAEVHSDNTLHLGPEGGIAKRTSDGQRVAISGGALEAVVAQLAEAEARTPAEEALALLEEMNRRLEATERRLESEQDAAERERRAAAKARSMAGQLPGWVISGLIGAVMGAALTVALGFD